MGMAKTHTWPFLRTHEAGLDRGCVSNAWGWGRTHLVCAHVSFSRVEQVLRVLLERCLAQLHPPRKVCSRRGT